MHSLRAGMVSLEMASRDFAGVAASSGCYCGGRLWLKRSYNLSASCALSKPGLKLTEDATFLKWSQGEMQRMMFEGPNVKHG